MWAVALQSDLLLHPLFMRRARRLQDVRRAEGSSFSGFSGSAIRSPDLGMKASNSVQLRKRKTIRRNGVTLSALKKAKW